MLRKASRNGQHDVFRGIFAKRNGAAVESEILDSTRYNQLQASLLALVPSQKFVLAYKPVTEGKRLK